ncbi:predicted protein [Chaetomium globosum CBS 148.51]|uniref:Fungal calcium binding protein domain-containing protein n=1 Tax=Chaetomium globosum (strain ATCC 6205 / CBS 148.51 / DSM 1962 / NBRC 6347 / NRRL 1970) TaxID=306901 RepID=Q2GU02_CHAGB|nr:uncharacterized protein CHGG_08552 [Chaetomium globosum CBS 148.51]EAQ84538.1 predicted protein [Chaetomium globosum CBS 148.51]
MKFSVAIVTLASLAAAVPAPVEVRAVDMESTQSGEWLACLNPCVRGCPKAGWLYLACVGACEVTCGAIANPGDVIDLDGLRDLGVDVDAA